MPAPAAPADAARPPITPAPYAWRPVGVVGALLAALLLAVSGRYGYHRDELYFLAAGRRPAWGYDDQPPLVPMLARVLDQLAPDSLVALRTPSALLAAASVLLVAAIARELGADRTGQVVAAIATAVAPIVVFTGHLLSTTTVEFTLAALLGWLLARWVRTGRDRLLLLSGPVVGVALLTKATFAMLVLALLAASVIVGPRRVLTRPALWAGAALALAAWAPYLWWQAQHDWPQFAMAEAIRAGEPGGGRILLLPMQVALLGIPMAAVALAGLWWLLRNPAARPFRFLGLGYLLLLAIFLVLGGQFYYPTSAFPGLLAAGGVVVAGRLARSPDGARFRRLATATVITAVTTVGLGLPVYPVSALPYTPQVFVFPDSAETVGWSDLVSTVGAVHADLPAAERSEAVILTGNYGQAGAIERYGSAYHLPAPYSGHNAYWRWGPPPDGGTQTVIFAGHSPPEVLRRHCGSLTVAASHDNRLGLDNQEQGVPVWLCRDLPGDWSRFWPELHHHS